MNETFTPQEQQQLNSTGMCDDSAVLDDSNIKESVAKRVEQEESRNKRILIVDDEPDITFTLRTILEENGYKEVDVYNEPVIALQDFKSGVYSLLITDIAMPRMDGFELYKQIKNIDTRIKVVFMTASRINYEALSYLTLLPVDRFDTSDEKDKVAISQGSGEEGEDQIHFIRKPVEIKEFIQILTKELQQGILGIEKTRCYKRIEFKQTRQQQY
jgi:CheY-like chemotaxis protein